MQVLATSLKGAMIIEPRVFGDPRGYFLETFQSRRYAEAGIPGPFVQDNLSLSRKGVLRGLHLQYPNPQGKLVSVLRGEVFDVAVDLRLGSPTFGQWTGVLLSEANKRQFWVPPGLAHGFLVTSDEALFHYKVTDYYTPSAELTLRWDDPDLAVAWPLGPTTGGGIEPQLAAKDLSGIPFKDLPRDKLLTFGR